MNKRSVLIASGLSLISTDVFSQALEEVVVTARKRAESLNDVPISVAVTSGDRLDQMSIGAMDELSATLPNVLITENATQTSVTIRGIGSGANQAFEQSVGTYVDGAYLGRGRSSRNSFFDIAQVEVLKGPQGILFGKNTIAGAVNITTRRPTEEFEAYVTGEYFDGIDQWGVTGVVSGPLSDTVRGRLGVMYRDSQGYVYNNFTGEDEGGKQQSMVRASLEWDVTERLSAFIKVATGSYDVEGRAAQSVAPSAVYPLALRADPDFETELDYTKSTTGDDWDNTDNTNVVVNLDYDLGGDWTLTSITSFVGYDFKNNVGAEFQPLEYVDLTQEQDYSQVAEELRIHYAPATGIQFIGGIYVSSEELDIFDSFNVDLGGIGSPAPAFSVPNTFKQDTDSFALFGELTFDITDRLQASLGARYSSDEKTMTKKQDIANLGSREPNPSLDPVGKAVLGRVPHNLGLDRKDSDTSPSLNLRYSLSDDSMIYASYSMGYKSGGFDASNATGDLANMAFDPEEVKAWELGGKFAMFDGAMRLNVAYFNNAYSDLQVAAWDGTKFVTGNAASATAKGIEADIQWQVTDGLRLSASSAWLDATYDKFPGASCYAGQSDGCFGNLQDLSGKDLQFSPGFSGNVDAEYALPMGALEWIFNLSAYYTDDYYTALDLDPKSIQESYTKVNARIQLGAANGAWSVALVGKNITDEVTTNWVNDIPAVGGQFALVEPPRTVGVQFTLSM